MEQVPLTLITLNRELLLLFWFTKTLYQPLYLLFTTATSHRGIGLFFNLIHGRSAIHDGIDNIYLKNLVTGTQVSA